MRFNNKNVILPQPQIDYLCFEAIEAGNIIFKAPNGEKPGWTVNVEYSFDKSTWTTLHINDTVSLQANDKIYFRGNNPNGFSYGRGADGTGTPAYWNVLIFSAKYNISGNIMTLIDKIGETTTIPNAYCFFRLFSNDNASSIIPNKNKAVDASKLVLPAVVLKRNCYASLFNDNDELIYPPKYLPNINSFEFESCANMFLRNYKLVETPILYATTLFDKCYAAMFYDCTSLKKVTSYASNISASNCLLNWLFGVSATGDFYNLGGATYSSGTSGIPSAWTVHTSL